MIGKDNWQQVLVFTRTKHGANRLSKQLESDGLTSAAIHGNKSQAARQRALNDFKKGEIRVLVATDVAARGLDIDLLPHVVNYDLPNVPEDYVHRIGRTARAGQQGHAISLVCIDEHQMLRDIEKLLDQRLEQVVLAGYEPDPSIKAEPIKTGRSNGRPQNRPNNRPGSRSNNRPGQSRGVKQGASAGPKRNSKSSGSKSSGQQASGNTRSSGTRGKAGGAKPGGFKTGGNRGRSSASSSGGRSGQARTR
jgi:ATP-dependent RNA helicase RhlE